MAKGKQSDRRKSLLRRKSRVRFSLRKVSKTDRPSLSVFKSCKHIYAQIIDIKTGNVMACASTLEKDVKGSLKSTSDINAASAVGKLVGKRAADKGIKEVYFDRSGYLYHGKIKSLAEAAREEGLKF